MTKKELQEENKRLREALERIVGMTNEEGVRKLQKSSDGMGQYAYTRIVGRVYSEAMKGLYGEDYLINPDKYKKVKGK